MPKTESQKTFFDIKNIIMQLPAHVFWLDSDHVVMGCNISQAKSLGFDSPQQIIGRRLDEFLKLGEVGHLMINNERVMREKKTLVIEESSLQPKQGSRVFLSSKSPLLDESGCVIGIIGIAQDITELKQNEAHILERTYEQLTSHRKGISSVRALVSEITGNNVELDGVTPLGYLDKVRNYYEHIIALMPGHVYWVNREGRVLGCNDTQAKSFGFNSHHDIVGKTCHELLPEAEADLLLQINLDVMEQGAVVTAEETGTMKNGQKKTYFSTKSPLFSENGDVMGILGTSLDISDRKIIEDKLIESQKQAEVANKAKTEFLMNMSHDLRTPFSGILGLSQLLYDNEQDVEKKALLEDIVTSGKQLLSLLNEIIDYTRVEAGEFRTTEDKVDLQQLIEEVLGLFAAEVQRKKLATTVSYADVLPRIFITDRVMLHRILLNLLSNAVKFTKQGKVTIDVGYAEDFKTISISVIDTGIGIASQDLEKIFEKFSRATLAHEGFYQGTGLGLSLVQRMVACLGGVVSVKSRPQEGAAFTCSLPLTPFVSEGCFEKNAELSVSSDNVSSDIEPILNQITRPNPRVLVVEDDSVSQRVAQYLLEACGCEVSLAGSAAQALLQYVTYYDLVLIDIGLPDMSGIELVKTMRSRLKAAGEELDHRVMLVALTAYVDVSLHDNYRSQGFDYVLRKPLTRAL